MIYSNLSKIKPKLRTEGRVSGNFGRNKISVGSTLNDIGVSNKKVVKVVNPEDYLARLYDAYDKTSDPKMKKFLYTEIRNRLIQTNRWHP
jgi:hypothetical protein